MDTTIQKFNDGLRVYFPTIDSIKHSFQFCSRYGEGKYLVDNQSKTINFDKLTEWFYAETSKPQSADSLSFSDNYLYLIEFKSGDPTTHVRKVEKLIQGVIGKINDSDVTLSNLFRCVFGSEETRIEERFCLVVDSKQMGITPLAMTLADLSKIDNARLSSKEKTLFNKVYPDLKLGISEPSHFSKIEICYSELFDTYVKVRKIKDAFSIT